MTTQPRLVNKQFNSPIGLYSQQNVQDVLEREQQILANGAIGIDFHNPSVGKPANLQNSAVLRMLEEEENRRGGRSGNGDNYPRPLQDLSWPPRDYDQKTHIRSSFKDVVVPGAKRVAWPPPQEGVQDPTEVAQQNAGQGQGGPQYSSQSPGLQQNNYSPQRAVPYQQPTQPSHRPLKPLDVSSVGTGSPLASPALNQSPHGFRSVTPVAGPKAWAPVHSPVTTPVGPGTQKSFGATGQGYSGQPQYQPVGQPYQEVNQVYPPTQGYQAPGQYNQPAQQYQPVSQQNQHSAQQYQAAGHHYQQSTQQHQQVTQQYQSVGQQYQQPSQYQAQQYSQQNSFSAQQPPYQTAPPQQQPQTLAQPAPFQNQVYPQVAQTQGAAPRPQPVKQVEPPPSTITLRPTAPVSQIAPPVYSAQPATASLKGGKHLRGDLKWPPENVRQRMHEEHKQLEELSKGPACRPTKKQKDYTPFFAQHALNSTYPGYKIPPGTQYFRPE